MTRTPFVLYSTDGRSERREAVEPGHSRGRIHVVDDDPSFLTAMERRLKQAGYDVVTYPSALHLLVNLPTESVPSCIILDVRMPN